MVTDKQFIYKNEARAAVLYENPSIVHCIDRLRVADAVEVVRCKDCVWYEREECNNPYIYMSDGSHLYTKSDDFCSYGERKMDNV